MSIRSISLTIHRWVGLVTGLIVFIVCLTGLIWSLKLNGWVGQYNLPHEYQSDRMIAPSQAVSYASTVVPGTFPTSLSYERNGAVEVTYSQGDTTTIVRLAPGTGKVIDTEQQAGIDFWKFIGAGHFSLWLPYQIGRIIVGYATLLFFLTLLSGLVLWLPKNRKGLGVALLPKWRRSTPLSRRVYDLHNSLGFYATLVLICISLTGMVWAVDWWGKGLYQLTSGGQNEIPWQLATSDTTTTAATMPQSAATAQLFKQTDSVFVKLLHSYPQAKAFLISLPDTAVKSSSLAITIQSDKLVYYDADRLSFDRYTMREIHVEGPYQGRYQDKNFADKLRRMNYDIHVGGIGGQLGRILVFIATFIGMTLPLTGFWLYYNRWRKKRKATNRKQ